MRYRLKSHESEVVELYRQGMSTIEIAKQFGVAHPSVRNCLIKMGISRRTGSAAHPLKDYCLRGHNLGGDNLYVSPQGIRGCRACREHLTTESKLRRPPQKVSSDKLKEYRTRWEKKRPGYYREKATGMTHEQFVEKQRIQKNLCAICGVFMNIPHADHDHETEQVRDLLCPRCNHGLGNFKDSILIVESALAYLKRWKAV